MQNYRVGVGDQVSVDFHLELDASLGMVDVNGDGTIQVKMIGKNVKVIGMTNDEIKAEIEKQSKDYFTNPSVVIRITPRIRVVFVTGYVGKPGPVQMVYQSGGLLFSSAMVMAGDVSPRGSRSNITLIRMENGKQEMYVVDYDEIVKGRHWDFYLKEGDKIHVEESWF